LILTNNYFVTGDYVVGGWVKGSSNGSLATGTLTIPDANSVPATGVPPGADIVAAFLYWETVESSNAGAQTGQQGTFNGYAITGSFLPSQTPNSPTSWSSGGCSGSSLGSKIIQGYRADVRPFLNLDANGKVQGNGSYQVKLADTGTNGSKVPFTLGASLVIVYRVESPLVPLNSVVIYDGIFAPSNTSSNASEMSQQMVGFYQAAALTAPVAKLTHIVGGGQSNKDQQVLFNGTALNLSGTSAFPGFYNGSWDNPTFDVSSLVPSGDVNPVNTTVVPAATNSNCVDWGAVIFSTTVEDTKHDGLLGVWKAPPSGPPGYTDAISSQFVALPGASPTAQDIFAEVDYLTLRDANGNILHSHLPKQLALDEVGDAFAKQGVHVHFDVGTNFNGVCKLTPPVGSQQPCPALDPYIIQGGTGGNEIPESATLCKDATSPTLCAFPGTPAVGWKEGFLFIKQNASVPNSTPPIPLGNFQFGRKDSYHYVLFGHALGAPRSFWTAFGATLPLPSPSFAKLISIVNSGIIATVTIQTPQGLVKPGDCPATPVCSSDLNGDRVTVTGAIGQPALNGTYHFTNLLNSGPDANNVITTNFNIATTNTTATCTVAPCVADGTYIFSNEAQLAVEYGGPTSNSGHSDLGGGDSAVTFGLWLADDLAGCQADPSVTLVPGQTYCTNQVGTITAEAGTLLHELGHTFFLTHGGTFFPNEAGVVTNGASAGQYLNSPPVVPIYGLNCNPGFLSSMNYLFQIRGFPDGGIDYSRQTLPDLSETLLNETLGIGSDRFTGQLAAHFTRWYAPPNALDTQLGRFATHHCDGTPVKRDASGNILEPLVVRVDGNTFSAPIDWNNDLIVPDLIEPVAWQDVNFNGSTSISPDAAFPGFNDWINVDLRQVGSRANTFGFSGGGIAQAGPNSGIPSDGPNAGIAQAGPNSGEQDEETACSTADPPTALMAFQKPKAHNVVLNWTPPGMCQVSRKAGYTIWRAVGFFSTITLANRTQFTPIGTVNAPSTTFTDNNVKNNTTYTYFVTDTNTQGATSGASNLVQILVSF